MTPAEVQLLQNAGQFFIEDVAIACCMAVLYGIYLTLSTMAMYSLWARGLKVKGTLILFLALGTVFLAYTVYLTTNIAALVVLLRGYLVANPNDPLKLRTGLANASAQPWIVAATWLAGSNSRILYWFGDAVVVWRAGVLFPRQKKINYALTLFFLCGIVLSLTEMILRSIVTPLAITRGPRSPVVILNLLNSIIFILVNAAATAFIAWQTYKHRRLLKGSLDEKWSSSVRIMVLLIETGALYCGIQTIKTILDFTYDIPTTPKDYVARIWGQIAIFASAVYPAALVLLINHQRSMANSSELKTIISNAGSNMHFASAPQGDRTNTETLLSFTTLRNQNKDAGFEQTAGQWDVQNRRWATSSCP